MQNQTSDEIEQIIAEEEQSFFFMTFSNLPDEDQKDDLKENGLLIHSYLPKNAYMVELSSELKSTVIKELGITSVLPISSQHKLDPSIESGLPDHAISGSKALLQVSFFNGHSNKVIEELRSLKAKVNYKDDHNHYLEVEIPLNNISLASQIAAVYFIAPIDPEPKPDNYYGRMQHRSSEINQEFGSGLKFDGSGISVGMQDDGKIGPHIDQQGRHTHIVSWDYSSHGDHVSGTITGAGNLDPDARGMASGAYMYVYGSGNSNYDYFNANAPGNHYDRYDIVITSKSYSQGCNGGYNNLANKLDRQSRENESLIHVFSAGNEGNSDCNYGAGARWGNITGGHKTGKNVITVANLNSDDIVRSSSSRGPTKFGRLKPDISGKGTSVYSTMPDYDYAERTGTSMSCPGISGSMAQLYQAYRSMNNEQYPSSDLMKALLLNGADDISNPGPDYKTGWGRVNVRRTYEMMKNKQYIQGQISSGTVQHAIVVPAGTEQLKVMLYWHDVQGSVNVSNVLVNDLDLKMSDPNAGNHLPLVLNPAPNPLTLDSNAKPGIDTLNNVEQIVIDQPATGTYTINVVGTNIPTGPQKYVIVYEFIKDEINVVFPNGGEGLENRDIIDIIWDAYGNQGSFNIEFSADGGGSWSPIATGISGSNRIHTWVVNNTITDRARIKISRGNVVDSSEANFTIIWVPENIQTEWICDDSLKLTWDNISFAESFRVYKLGEKYMDSIGTTTENEFVVTGTKANERYWVAVSSNPKENGPTGKRSIAFQTEIGPKDCPAVSSVHEQQNEESELFIFPNPAEDELQIVYSHDFNGPSRITVLDLQGKTVISQAFIADASLSTSISVGELEAGSYILQLSQGDKMQSTSLNVR